MKKYLKKGFTLVELVIVIIIIWILSTISFVSYKQYTSDARDSKRVSDVNSLVKQIELAKTQGADIFTIIMNTSSTIQNNIQISGYTGSWELGINYLSWDPDFTWLNVEEDLYIDPLTWDNYKIGVTSFWERYEVASSIENQWEASIYAAWTWVPRTSENARASRKKIVWKVYYMSGVTKNSISLEVDDIVRIWTWTITTYTIKRIQLDKIVLDRVIDPSNNWENLFLNNDETRHLIKKWDSDYAIEEDLGSSYGPYDLWL